MKLLCNYSMIINSVFLDPKFPCHLTLGNLWLGCSRKSTYASMKLHPLHFPSTSLAFSLPLLLAPSLLSHLQLLPECLSSLFYVLTPPSAHPFPWLSTVYTKIFWNLLSLNDLFSYHMRVGLCEMNNGRIDGMLLPRQGHCTISAHCCFLDCMLQGKLAAISSGYEMAQGENGSLLPMAIWVNHSPALIKLSVDFHSSWHLDHDFMRPQTIITQLQPLPISWPAETTR